MEKRMEVIEADGDWLSLGGVARLLGVHPSTVRGWSDQGALPVHRTRGGHRRYRRNELELWLQSRRASGVDGMNLVVQQALRNTRFQISEGRLAAEGWYNRLDDESKSQYRESGRNLLQGLVSFLYTDGDQALEAAEALGYEYALRGRRCGLNRLEATHAFLFFRNVLIESMLSVYESAAIQSPHAWSSMFRRVNEFTDRIMLTILETFEAYQQAMRS
jgi:excisionase family DNA binding protein